MHYETRVLLWKWNASWVLEISRSLYNPWYKGVKPNYIASTNHSLNFNNSCSAIWTCQLPNFAHIYIYIYVIWLYNYIPCWKRLKGWKRKHESQEGSNTRGDGRKGTHMRKKTIVMRNNSIFMIFQNLEKPRVFSKPRVLFRNPGFFEWTYVFIGSWSFRYILHNTIPYLNILYIYIIPSLPSSIDLMPAHRLTRTDFWKRIKKR